ncbi:palmitoyltransferase pfa5 [Aspergillus fumigatus]|nr:palmitoyltransferase pfa5 [Aspergillus fumigatus]KAH1554220.1 palmitoyltransferase pfa5 [Aspergillus fumigatus]KAH2918704.1 palmitoyltransferase pfa5 [Aspergillus fumigatus]KAH3208177.1 palmitoyltransferase pfa5 [Aspergillus fumigatus]KAH3539641.1 palmitoyltransferase pfa5 [Aspergillus fumigatus]
MARRAADKRVNLAVSRIIPPILIGVFGYASYAITKPLCVDYLIHPAHHYDRRSRSGAGAAILAIYYVLLIPALATYLRLLYNVVLSPGYLPRGTACAQNQTGSYGSKHRHRRHRRRKSGHHLSKTTEKTDRSDGGDVERGLEYSARAKAYPLDAEGLESFYTKDVFVCQPDGRPVYCSTCCQFKTDRAHHCREVDRCVRKMDHFCPWVGGVVSETSFKFFIQFIVYTMIYCIFVLIVFAIYTAELGREAGRTNVHWIVCLALSSLFGFFTFGMAISSVQLAANNLTTIENLNRRSAVWTLAIRVPRHILSKRWAPTFRTITYPLPPVPPAESEVARESPGGEQHVFAILQTLPGENPFDLGSPLKNIQQVMGFSLLEWLLPIKQSPCADHSSNESAFALGPVVTRLKKEAGLEISTESESADPVGAAETPQHEQRRGKHRRRN